jgi:uncharacterized protein YjbJ (UPF0337 family)
MPFLYKQHGAMPHKLTKRTIHAILFVKKRSIVMSGKKDQIKGRIKEATGVITDDDRLKREGKVDQLVGKMKEKATKAAERMRTALTGNPSSHRTK